MGANDLSLKRVNFKTKFLKEMNVRSPLDICCIEALSQHIRIFFSLILILFWISIVLCCIIGNLRVELI